MRQNRFLYFMALVCALLWISPAQGADYQWYMDTDNGESIAMSEVEYLLRSDGAADFSVVVRNGNPVVGVHRVTFSKKQATGIESGSAGQVRIYPNPVQDNLCLSGLSEGSRVEIVALDGRVVKSVVATGADVSISVADLSQGSYLLKTAGSTLKFIKR